MKKHLYTLSKKREHRLNLFIVLSIVTVLIITGLQLTFHRYFPPIVSSVSLFFHDAATWFGVPYATYHSVTRSKWFKRLTARKTVTQPKEEPMMISEENPVYRRRTFLKLLSGSIIAVAFLPSFLKWIKPFLPEDLGSSEQALPDGNNLNPLPSPSPKSAPPIGGGRRGEFRYYTVTEIPEINNDNFSFAIDGHVGRKQKWNWNQFVNVHRDVQVSDFHCVTGWSVYDVTCEGIPLKKLLQEAGVKDKAKYVKFYSADGVYTDTLTIEQAMMDDIMVAVLIDGKLISQNNGGPVRLIVPKMYAYKSVKWLNRIELIEKEHVGYWEKRGYDKNAWVKSI
ncbi:MAG: molybdopterin-dependent oxidoreductase [Bacillota bacterium]